MVTDSTASLPAGTAEPRGVLVVPLEVAIGDARYAEGVDLDPAVLVRALSAGTRVTTSQPSPAAFALAYARAAERGAREIVSVHLSGELSGTVRAAELAARDAPVPVHVVDSRSVAMGLGFAALAAAGEAPGAVAATGEWAAGDGARSADRAREVAGSASALFLVDSLEHLRRGGRIGPAAAAVGTVLGMRPLLTVRAGRVEVAGKVRTRRAARDRLVAAAAEAVAGCPHARVAVHHLGEPDVAADLAAEIRARVPSGVDVVTAPVSAVVAAHAGPGLLGVVAAVG